MNSVPLTTALLDPTRLMVAGSLRGAIRTAAQVADRTGAALDDVQAAIDALQAIGLVEPADAGFTLPDAALMRLTHELKKPTP